MKHAICFLVINRIPVLPKIAIESALDRTDCEIYIGYLNLSDIEDLPVSNRINFVDLSNQAANLGIQRNPRGYVGFNEEDFFKLVQLKWDLFLILCELDSLEVITYLDLDVVVLRDFVSEFSYIFDSKPKVNCIIQDATSDPSESRLCMGVFAFRSGENSIKILNTCKKIHEKALRTNKKYGDDDAITDYFIQGAQHSEFFPLPQQSFPIGKLANLYLPFRVFRHLRPSIPYIFHANYVVGNKRKVFLIYMLLARLDRKYLLKALISLLVLWKDIAHRYFTIRK